METSVVGYNLAKMMFLHLWDIFNVYICSRQMNTLIYYLSTFTVQHGILNNQFISKARNSTEIGIIKVKPKLTILT